MGLGCSDTDVQSGVPCWDIGTVKVDSRVVARVAINDSLLSPNARSAVGKLGTSAEVAGVRVSFGRVTWRGVDFLRFEIG